MINKKGIEFLDTGIFPATVCFVYGMGFNELLYELFKMEAIGWASALEQDESFFEEAKNLAMKRAYCGVTYYFISIRDFDFSDHDMCKLAHEVLHICQFFLPDVLDRNREIEAECYLHTHLMMQCLKILRKAQEQAETTKQIQ